MEIALWLTQSCLLAVALFVSLGEELVLNPKGNALFLNSIPVLNEKTQHQPNMSQCYLLEKPAKWQISFGVLTAAHATFLLVLFRLRSHKKSPQPILPVLCVTSWLMVVLLLCAKIVIYLTPNVTTETGPKGDYLTMILTVAWEATTAHFEKWSQRIFHAVVHSIQPSNYMQDFIQWQLNKIYVCLPEGMAMEEFGPRIPRATFVLVITYCISSGYVILLVLNYEEDTVKMSCEQFNSRRKRSAKHRDYGCDSLDLEGEEMRQRRTIMCKSKNCLRGKEKFSVAFLEESDEESFVFGWRL